MLDILIIVACLSITAVVAWCEGAKHERKNMNKQTYIRKKIRKYLDNEPLPRLWD